MSILRGFVEIDRADARQACVNYDKIIAEGKRARENGILRYRAEVYPQMGWFHRWRYRNDSALTYCRRRLRYGYVWGDLSEILHVVLSADELAKLKVYEDFGEHNQTAIDLRSLVDATHTTHIYVGEGLARFYNRWRDK